MLESWFHFPREGDTLRAPRGVEIRVFPQHVEVKSGKPFHVFLFLKP